MAYTLSHLMAVIMLKMTFLWCNTKYVRTQTTYEDKRQYKGVKVLWRASCAIFDFNFASPSDFPKKEFCPYACFVSWFCHAQFILSIINTRGGGGVRGVTFHPAGMMQSGNFVDLIASTVKPAWNDHPWYKEKVVFPNRWSFQQVQFAWNPLVDRLFHKFENGLSSQGVVPDRVDCTASGAISVKLIYKHHHKEVQNGHIQHDDVFTDAGGHKHMFDSSLSKFLISTNHFYPRHRPSLLRGLHLCCPDYFMVCRP